MSARWELVYPILTLCLLPASHGLLTTEHGFNTRPFADPPKAPFEYNFNQIVSAKFDNENRVTTLTLDSSFISTTHEIMKNTCPNILFTLFKPISKKVREISWWEEGRVQVSGGLYNGIVDVFGWRIDDFYYAVAIAQQPECASLHEAVAGLSLPAADDERKYSLFSQLMAVVTEKVLIIHRGPANRRNKDGKMPDDKTLHGHINVGAPSMTEYCNDPPAYHEVHHSFEGIWGLRAEVIIGTQKLAAQNVGFSLDDFTRVNNDIRQRYFRLGQRSPEARKEKPWPSVRFSLDNHTYFMVDDDYINFYPDGNTSAVLPKLKDRSHVHMDHVLGTEFLQNYCLFLKLDADGKQVMGLGRVKGTESDVPPLDDKSVDKPASRPSTALGVILIAALIRLI